MAMIGMLYLVFQKKLLGHSKLADESVAPANDSLSRVLVGVQVTKPASSASQLMF